MMVAALWQPQLGGLAGSLAEGGASDFSDVYEAARRETLTGHTVAARQFALEQAIDEKNDRIKALTGVALDNPYRQPIAPVEEGMAESAMSMDLRLARQGPQGRRSEYERNVATYLQRLSDLRQQYPDNAGLFDEPDPDKAAKAQVRANERTLASASSRGPGYGGTFAAQFAGGFVGSMQDPLQLVGNVLAPGAGTGRSLLYHGLKSAAINAGVEASIQPMIQAWRKEAGVDYGLGEAARDIGTAAAFGGLLDVGVRGAYRTVRVLRGQSWVDVPATRENVERALDDAAQRLPEGHPIREAAEGRPEPLVREIEALGDRAPAELRALAARADDDALSPLPEGMDEVSHLEALAQAVRHAVAPDVEPPGFAGVRAADLEAAVQSGEIPPTLADAVARAAPDDRQVALARLALERGLETPEAVRRMIAEDLQRPAAREPARSGAMEFDEPAGPGAKAQVEALQAELAPRLAEPERPARAAGDAAAELPAGPTREAVRAELGRVVDELRAMMPRNVVVRSFVDLAEIPATAARQSLEQRGGRVVDAKTGSVVAAFADGDLIMIADYALEPRGRLAHEVVHALRTAGLVAPQELRLLAERAREEGVLGREAQARYEAAYKARYPDDWQTRVEEEAAAHLIEARASGRSFGKRIDGIADRLRQIMERLANALRGLGFRTADDVADAILGGAAANRDPVRAWMRDNDISAMAVRADGDAGMFAIGDVANRVFDRVIDATSGPRTGKPYEARTYHGNSFSLFDTEKMAAADQLWSSTSKSNAAEYAGHYRGATGDAGYIAPLRVRFENPLVVAPPRGTLYDSIPFEGRVLDIREIADVATARGHDGLVVRRIRDVPLGDGEVADTVAALKNGTVFSATTGDLMFAISDRETGQSMRRDMDALGYRSAALEAARSLKQAKGTPEQMLAQLKSAGAKKMELDGKDRTSIWYDVPEDQQIVRFADGKSVSQLSYSSEPPIEGFPTIKGDLMFAILAFHGSPHDFDRFDMSRIGTGEGAQAYGHGLYFAEREGVARSYRDSLGGQRFKDGSAFDDSNPAHQASAYIAGTKSKDDALAAIEQDIVMSRRQMDEKHAQILLRAKGLLQRDEPIPELNSGRLYEVRIDANADDFLDWDKPLSQQSEKVRALAQASQFSDYMKARRDAVFPRPVEETGEMLVRALGAETGEGAASSALREAGIPGIKYLDQGSRTAGEGSRNYVIFDDSLIEIVAKDGQPIEKAERQSVIDGMTGKKDADGSGPMFAISDREPDPLTAARAEIARADEGQAAARMIGGGAGPGSEGQGGQAGQGQPMFSMRPGGLRGAIEEAVAGKAMSREQADEVLAIYDRFLRQHQLAYGDAEAARRAQADTAERLEAEAAQRRRAALLQVKTAEMLDAEMMRHTNARGDIDPAQFMWMVLEHHGQTDNGLRTGSVEGRRKALVADAHRRLEGLLYEFRTTALAGRRMNKARLDDVVREAFGKDTGDAAAKGFAKAWAEVAEDFRQRYNELGGSIGKRKDWGLPQRHDAAKIKAATFKVWREDQLRLLAPERMTDHLTGKPVTPDDLEDALRHAYDGIITEGWAHRDPSMQPKGRGALVRQHAESRFFVYKDADAWLEYQRKYGEGDVFATMMGHVHLMARDIAAMQVLGPNPEATREWLRQKLMKLAQDKARGLDVPFPGRGEMLGRELDPVDYANRMIHVSDQMWAHMRGSAGTPVSTWAATVVGAARNLVTGFALTGSSLSAIATDPFIQKTARMYAGVDYRQGRTAFGLDLVKTIVRQMSTAQRYEAVRAGLILDSAMNVMRDEARGVGFLGGPEWSRWFVDRVLTLNGLQGLTQAEKHAFGMDMMSSFADHQQAPWDTLPAPLRRTAGRYGFDADDWKLIGLAERHDLSPEGDGAFILRPADIAEVRADAVRRALADAARADLVKIVESRILTKDELDVFLGRADPKVPDPEARTAIPTDPPDVKVARYMRDLAERYHEMILQETTRAVPEAIVRGRAAIIGDNQPGTLVGEALRSAAMFKSFGVSVAMLHMGQVIREAAGGWKPGSAGYAAALAIGLPIGGAIAIHLKAIRDGRDPDSMASTEFWLRAMAQGGGWGIYGDFVLADTNRMGGSWSSTVAGPMVQRAENIWNLTAGNLRQLSSDKNTNFGAELTRFVQQNTPFVNMPYTKLAWDRLVIDRMREMLDPNASTAWRRMQTDARKKGSGFWWGPGSPRPERWPSINEVFNPPPAR